MSIDCPLSLYDVTVTNMATVRNVQIAIIERMTLTEYKLVLFVAVTILLCLYDHKYDYSSNNTVMSI